MASTVLPLSLSAGANDFTVSGEIRSGFVEYDYSTPLDSRAFAAIFKAGVETPKYRWGRLTKNYP
jgi:hypothetical protein